MIFHVESYISSIPVSDQFAQAVKTEALAFQNVSNIFGNNYHTPITEHFIAQKTLENVIISKVSGEETKGHCGQRCLRDISIPR